MGGDAPSSACDCGFLYHSDQPCVWLLYRFKTDRFTKKTESKMKTKRFQLPSGLIYCWGTQMSHFILLTYVTLLDQRYFSCYYVDRIACLFQCLKINPLFFLVFFLNNLMRARERKKIYNKYVLTQELLQLSHSLWSVVWFYPVLLFSKSESRRPTVQQDDAYPREARSDCALLRHSAGKEKGEFTTPKSFRYERGGKKKKKKLCFSLLRLKGGSGSQSRFMRKEEAISQITRRHLKA